MFENALLRISLWRCSILHNASFKDALRRRSSGHKTLERQFCDFSGHYFPLGDFDDPIQVGWFAESPPVVMWSTEAVLRGSDTDVKS